MMTDSRDEAGVAVLLRHIPGSIQFQGKQPHRITSENFKPRRNNATGRIEDGISVTACTMGSLHQSAENFLKLRRTSADSRVGFAKQDDVIQLGFNVEKAPTGEDPEHCLIKSNRLLLTDHESRKRLANLFHWWQPNSGT